MSQQASWIIDVGFYTHGLLGKPFSYILPTHISVNSLSCGMLVQAPLQGVNRRGVILRIKKEVPTQQMLSIIDLIPHSFGGPLLPWQAPLALWLAEYYFSPMHRVIQQLIPEKIWQDNFHPKRSTQYRIQGKCEDIPPRAKKKHALYTYVSSHGTVARSQLLSRFSSGLITSSLKEHILREIPGPLEPTSKHETTGQLQRLTKEQDHIFHTIIPSKTPYLLHGVTGAGKTEIYMHLASKAMGKGKQTLILIPEIALTTQITARARSLFGEKVSLLHSKLSHGTRLQEWCRIRSEDTQVIIGSRLSILSPFSNLGMIIIDEEHEWSFKSDQNPKYDARVVAEKMLELLPSMDVLLFGSATPRVELWQRTQGSSPNVTYLSLPKKIHEQTPSS